jgi:hypothetical protein
MRGAVPPVSDWAAGWTVRGLHLGKGKTGHTGCWSSTVSSKMSTVFFFTGLNWPGRDVDYLPLLTPKLRMGGGIPHISLYSFMVWCLTERRDRFVTAGRRRWRAQYCDMLTAVFRKRTVV